MNLVESKSCYSVQPLPWERHSHDLSSIAEPLLISDAFRRLESITFLGILSPGFSSIITSPLFNGRTKEPQPVDSGDRKSHSIGVALIFLDLAKNLGLSIKAQRHAVAWGLLHDVATWPLSHTGEPAFSAITNTSSSSLRGMMLTGSKRLPQSLTLVRELKELGISPNVLLSLFENCPTRLDTELKVLWEIARSPVTPDSLEGIWRAGLAFGVDVPHPNAVQKSISKSLFGTVVTQEYSKIVLKFWRQKAKIYHHFINRSDVVRWESAWSAALRKHFQHLDLVGSLLVTEKELIDTVRELSLPRTISVYRYKNPLSYYVYPLRKRVLRSDQPLLCLRNILKKEIKDKGKPHGIFGTRSTPK